MPFRRVAFLLVLCAVLIVALGAVTDIDMRLAQSMAGDALPYFPMRDTWFAETFSHQYIKYLMLVLGACAVVPVVVDIWRPRPRWSPRSRLRLRVVAASAVLVPTIISLLKRVSFSHCPWDLTVFGGMQPYVRLLDAHFAGVPAGHCMPAGHASSALWLVALAVFWLPEHPRKAAAVGALMLLFGFALGWMQQLRGAHFLTHTLWSMWIACAVVCLLWRFATRKAFVPLLVQAS